MERVNYKSSISEFTTRPNMYLYKNLKTSFYRLNIESTIVICIGLSLDKKYAHPQCVE